MRGNTGRKQRQILPADDPSVKAGNPYDMRDFDIAIIVDTPLGCGLAAGMIEFDGDRITDVSQDTVPDRHSIYIVAIFGNPLDDGPMKLARSGVVRAYTFGDKIQAWVAENSDVRAETLRRQIRALGTDIGGMIEEATRIHSSQPSTLH